MDIPTNLELFDEFLQGGSEYHFNGEDGIAWKLCYYPGYYSIAPISADLSETTYPELSRAVLDVLSLVGTFHAEGKTPA